MRARTQLLTITPLSTTFANNVGPDDTIVFNRGPLALTSAGTDLFDITINFDTPFLYDPALGNLLLDVRNFGGTPNTTPAFDSQSTFGDSISRLWEPDVASAGLRA